MTKPFRTTKPTGPFKVGQTIEKNGVKAKVIAVTPYMSKKTGAERHLATFRSACCDCRLKYEYKLISEAGYAINQWMRCPECRVGKRGVPATAEAKNKVKRWLWFQG